MTTVEQVALTNSYYYINYFSKYKKINGVEVVDMT